MLVIKPLMRLVRFVFILAVLNVSSIYSNSVQLTFELPDNEVQCFYEHVNKGVNTVVEFQVRYNIYIHY